MYRVFVVLCFTITAFFGKSAFAGEIVEVSVLDIHPTQPAAGYAASAATQFLKFKNVRDETSLRERIIQEKPLRGVRGPGGDIYLTDGHHRALGMYRTSVAICESIRTEADSCARSIKVRVEIDVDFSSRTWDEFSDALLKDNNMYLPPAIREKLASGSLARENIFRDVLPRSLAKLADDPMRSAIGTLFHHQGINGNNFANYLEFLVAEKLNDKIVVQVGQEADIGVQIRLLRAIFGNQELVRYIRCLARKNGEDWKNAQRQINAVVGLDAETAFEQKNCEVTKQQR